MHVAKFPMEARPETGSLVCFVETSDPYKISHVAYVERGRGTRCQVRAMNGGWGMTFSLETGKAKPFAVELEAVLIGSPPLAHERSYYHLFLEIAQEKWDAEFFYRQLPAFQRRLVDEKRALDLSLFALDKFRNSDEFERISTEVRSLLDDEALARHELSQILGRRINRWKELHEQA